MALLSREQSCRIVRGIFKPRDQSLERLAISGLNHETLFEVLSSVLPTAVDATPVEGVRLAQISGPKFLL